MTPKSLNLKNTLLAALLLSIPFFGLLLGNDLASDQIGTLGGGFVGAVVCVFLFLPALAKLTKLGVLAQPLDRQQLMSQLWPPMIIGLAIAAIVRSTLELSGIWPYT